MFDFFPSGNLAENEHSHNMTFNVSSATSMGSIDSIPLLAAAAPFALLPDASNA